VRAPRIELVPISALLLPGAGKHDQVVVWRAGVSIAKQAAVLKDNKPQVVVGFQLLLRVAKQDPVEEAKEEERNSGRGQ
jgi:hypothetical protein